MTGLLCGKSPVGWGSQRDLSLSAKAAYNLALVLLRKTWVFPWKSAMFSAENLTLQGSFRPAAKDWSLSLKQLIVWHSSWWEFHPTGLFPHKNPIIQGSFRKRALECTVAHVIWKHCCARHVTHLCVTWLIYVWRDSFVCDMTHTHVTWLIRKRHASRIWRRASHCACQWVNEACLMWMSMRKR